MRDEHPSFTRLMEVMRELAGISKAADLARLLNISEQVVTNWKSRGISKDALIDLSDQYAFRIKYVLTGDGQKLQTVSAYPKASPIYKVLELMQQMDEATKYQAVKIIDTLAEPKKLEGTNSGQ